MSERDEFGPGLRRERERRGITLQHIAEQTKIGAALFAGLERNDVSRWPSGIYRRSFVRAYAAAVGLDGERLVDEFRRLFPEDGDGASRPEGSREIATNPERGSRQAPFSTSGSSESRGNGLRLHLDAASAVGPRPHWPARAASGPRHPGASVTTAAPGPPTALRLQLESLPAAPGAPAPARLWCRGLVERAPSLAVDLALVAIAGILVLVAFGWPAAGPAMAAASCVVLVAAPVIVRTTPGTWLLGLHARPPVAGETAAEPARRRTVEHRPAGRRHRTSVGSSSSFEPAAGRHPSAHAMPHGHRRAARRLGK